ncbi:hypothetical protein G3580_02215 [Nitrogeniibacter mangrovi]|uniref:PilZ domain-containing protein n=1 Tax=Nitrogeniibacter mangrovi TaxID=2016596 RepID=A0A6C1AZI5_9RHOO|nr:hypothetical protein [Nitrogeniibacter mangrovi]QID16543.1 hypothetical protein G3580_02215 [Nitrogeniibacter mangrovi]
MDEINERRQRQRVIVDQDSATVFRLSCDGAPMHVRDVSLDGFAMQAATAPDARHEFAFRLEHSRLPGVITGRAQVVNYARGVTADSGVAGCRILSVDGDGGEMLAQWLSEHVTRVASLPLTADEARHIVAGPSLV